MKKRVLNYCKENWVLILLLFVLLLLCGISWYKIHGSVSDICDELESVDVLNDYPINTADKSTSLNHTDLYLRFHEFRSFGYEFLIAFIGTVITAWALYVQYIFNKTQKNDLSEERFTNKYFHLLDVYRDLCKSIVIPNVGCGKAAFHYMFYEYKAIWNCLEKENIISDKVSKLDKNKVVFSIFIDGLSRDFVPKIDNDLISEQKIILFRDELLKGQKISEQSPNEDNGFRYLRDYKGRKIKYFDGHRLRLIPYFKYVILIFDHILSYEKFSDQLTILKYLYSEMSEHEIGLLNAYMHYNNINKKYKIFLDKLLDELCKPADERYRFDSDNFIVSESNESKESPVVWLDWS